VSVDLSAAGFPLDSYRDAAVHLRRPFAPAAVNFKVQTQTGPKDSPNGGLVVAYIDMRLVIERLNLIVPHLWYDAYEPLADGKGLVCALTIDGITRCDVGQADAERGGPKALYSDALKRAAVKFGVGVSIYAIAQVYFRAGDGSDGKTLRVKGQQKKRVEITDALERNLRTGYEKWLARTGEASFGPVLDHGDEAGAQGSGEAAGPPAPEHVDPETGEIHENGATAPDNGAPTEKELRDMMGELGWSRGKVNAKFAGAKTPAARTALGEQLSDALDAREDTA
jgi:hypothetical protein